MARRAKRDTGGLNDAQLKELEWAREKAANIERRRGDTDTVYHETVRRLEALQQEPVKPVAIKEDDDVKESDDGSST